MPLIEHQSWEELIDDDLITVLRDKPNVEWLTKKVIVDYLGYSHEIPNPYSHPVLKRVFEEEDWKQICRILEAKLPEKFKFATKEELKKAMTVPPRKQQ